MGDADLVPVVDVETGEILTESPDDLDIIDDRQQRAEQFDRLVRATELARLEATDIEPLKDVHDRAEALLAYAKKARLELQQQNRVAATKLRIERDGSELVLDPFLGAGTTGVAASRLGCRFIGADIDKGHVAVARGRMVVS